MMFSSRHRWAWRQTLVGVLAFFTLPSLIMGDEPMSDPPTPRVAKVRIVLAGDSTVANGQGWGSAFAGLLADRVECINLARNGRSSKSFYNEGLWAKCLEAKPDYILIQFGHNDQPGKGPDRETDPQTTYRQNMSQYVDQSRAAGSIPILVTSLSRREFGADGKIHSTLVPYVEVVKQLAQEKDVPLVDLHARSIELYERLGEKACAELSPSPAGTEPDRTHLSAKGAKIIAPLVLEELKISLPAAGAWFKAGQDASTPVKASIETDPTQLRAGDQFNIALNVQISPGWHIAALDRAAGTAPATKIDLELPEGLQAMGKWELPPTSIDTSHPGVAVYSGSAAFRSAVRVARDAAPGDRTVRCVLSYQACDRFTCRLPEELTTQATIHVLP